MDSPERRVIVGVDGSAGSLRALRRGVAEARLRTARLVVVLAWSAPGGEDLARRFPCGGLEKPWQAAAARRLRGAWDSAVGGIPADLVVRSLTVRGPAEQVLVRLADREDDLLIIGAGGRVRWTMRQSVTGYCTTHASCPVLVVPRSTLRAVSHRRLLRTLATPGS